MKKIFVKFSSNLIKKYNPDLDDVKLAEIKYGLESFYLILTKAIVILTLAALLKIIDKTIIVLIFYNMLRECAFGVHAKKSWQCWASSFIIFIGIPIFAQNIIIPFHIKLILGIIAIIIFFIYAPADTKSAPIINPKRRKYLKITATFLCVLFVIFSLVIDSYIGGLILLSVYIEVILILPITYKMLHTPYNNYRSYVPSYIK